MEIENNFYEKGPEGLNETRKREIRESFRGILADKDAGDLNTLPIKEVFELLSGYSAHAALHHMYKFPRNETVDFLMKLKKDKKFPSETNTIDWLMGKLLHNPKTFNKAIHYLKEVNDSRVFFETEKGIIRMEDNQSIVEEIIALYEDDNRDDWAKENRIFLESSLKSGALFTFRDKNNNLTTFVLAHQNDTNYILFIDFIYTNPKYRKQGYAKEMIEYLKKIHAVLGIDLFRDSHKGLLSADTLEQLGFKKDKNNEKWSYRKPIPNKNSR